MAAGAGAPANTEQLLYADLTNVWHFTAAQAAGFLGNFQTESGFNPNAWNPREQARGFAQWEGGRRTGSHGLQAYASSHGLSEVDPLAQVGYLNQELAGGYADVVRSVRGTNDPRAAASIVQSRFEGSTPDSLGARQNNASAIYAQIIGGHPLTGGVSLAGSAGGYAGFLSGTGGPSNPPVPYPVKWVGSTTLGSDGYGVLTIPGKGGGTFKVKQDGTLVAGSRPLPAFAWVKIKAYDIAAAIPSARGKISKYDHTNLLSFYVQSASDNNPKSTYPGPFGQQKDPNAFSGPENFITDALKSVGHALASAGILIAGVLLVVMALWLVARDSASSSSASSSPAPPSRGRVPAAADDAALA